MPIVPGELDTDNMALNALNGTLDLTTGVLRDQRSSDRITTLAPTAFDADTKCPTWEAFMSAVFGDDADLVRFVQRYLRYTLTGRVNEQRLAIFHGGGANGKSTLLNAVFDVLGGDYAIRAAPGLAMAKPESHSTELADLFGVRLTLVNETDSGRRLAEGTVKGLTGGDLIRARRMRQDFWEFKPTSKFVICTNHKPEITGTDHGIWRRIRLVPFRVRFWNPDTDPAGPAHLRQDKALADRLRGEREGILAWLVRGCLDWQANGLPVPTAMAEEVASYRDSQDIVGRFLEERCVSASGARVKSSVLYAAYRS